MVMETFISKPYQYQNLIVIVTIVLQDVTAGVNWVNGMRDLSVLYIYISTTCESTIILNKKIN